MATKTVNISLPREVLDKIDRRAKEEYKSRSDLIRDAALQYMRNRTSWDVLLAEAPKRAKALGIKTEDDVERIIDESRS